MEIETRIEEALEYIQNDTNYALELFNGILIEQPNNINAINGKGSTLMKLHRTDEALDAFDYSLSIGDSSSAYLNKGRILKNKQMYKDALKCFDKAVESNPNLCSIVSKLKNEIFDSVKIESSNLDLLYDFSPKANELIKEALDYKNENKIWDCLDSFEAAIKEDPTCQNSVNDLMKNVNSILLKEFVFKQPPFENPQTTRFKSIAYRSLLNEENPQKTLQIIDRILKIDENDLEALNIQGTIYFNLNDYEKAIEIYDKCLKIDKNYSYALFNKGLVLRRAKHFNESLECFNKLLTIDDFSKKVKLYYDETLEKVSKK